MIVMCAAACFAFEILIQVRFPAHKCTDKMLTWQGKDEEICNSHTSLVRDNTSVIKFILVSMKCLSDIQKQQQSLLFT